MQHSDGENDIKNHDVPAQEHVSTTVIIYQALRQNETPVDWQTCAWSCRDISTVPSLRDWAAIRCSAAHLLGHLLGVHGPAPWHDLTELLQDHKRHSVSCVRALEIPVVFGQHDMRPCVVAVLCCPFSVLVQGSQADHQGLTLWANR